MSDLIDKRKRASEYTRAWRRRNPAKAKALRDKWRRENPEKHKASARRQYEKSKAAIKARVRKWREENRELVRSRNREKSLQSKYGLTVAAFNAMLEGQGNRCAVCCAVSGPWVVDHDHSTGKVRGVLCRPCNTGLGCFKDNEVVLISAVKYLKVS